MKRYNKSSTGMAKERLLMMAETEPLESCMYQMKQMKREISNIVNRYLNLDSEDYEIKIIPNKTKKRE